MDAALHHSLYFVSFVISCFISGLSEKTCLIFNIWREFIPETVLYFGLYFLKIYSYYFYYVSAGGGGGACECECWYLLRPGV